MPCTDFAEPCALYPLQDPSRNVTAFLDIMEMAEGRVFRAYLRECHPGRTEDEVALAAYDENRGYEAEIASLGAYLVSLRPGPRRLRAAAHPGLNCPLLHASLQDSKLVRCAELELEKQSHTEQVAQLQQQVAALQQELAQYAKETVRRCR